MIPGWRGTKQLLSKTIPQSEGTEICAFPKSTGTQPGGVTAATRLGEEVVGSEDPPVQAAATTPTLMTVSMPRATAETERRWRIDQVGAGVKVSSTWKK